MSLSYLRGTDSLFFEDGALSFMDLSVKIEFKTNKNHRFSSSMIIM